MTENKTTAEPATPADEAISYLNYEFAAADRLTVRAVASVTAEIYRLRATLASYSAVPFRCDDCLRKLSVTEIMNVRR